MPTERLVLRPYQEEGVEFLSSRPAAILADEMGLGKTVQTLEAWKGLGYPGPALLIARPNAQAAWLRQAPLWGIQTPYIISGTQTQREKEWMEVDKYSFVTITMESLRRDIGRVPHLLPKKWGFVMVDEAHRLGLCNRKTEGFNTVRHELEYDHIALITGSPLRRGFQDLWSLLNICNPKQFSSYWRYLQTFGFTQRNEHGAWEVLGLKEKDKLLQIIAPYYIRRRKVDVAPELPPKFRELSHRLILTPKQAHLYDQISEEMIGELSDGSLLTVPTILAKITRLRQILCTPKLLDPAFPEYGSCIEHLGDLLDEADSHHMVIYTPFAEAIPYIQNYLLDKFGIDVPTLRGGTLPLEINRIIDDFRKRECPIICSISFAESFDLDPASWGYFCGFSWSLSDNLQAEDRQHRLTTMTPVTYYYPFYLGCIDEQLMLEVLETNATEITKIYQASPDRLKDLLRRKR